jgi:protein-disulfide isomerase
MLSSVRTLAVALSALSLLAACGQKSASDTGSGGAVSATSAAPVLTDAGVAFGNPAAKVKVVEYASASCSHCARFDADVFPAFRKKYIDTGLVRYEFREFLTPPEQYAAAAFALARCAGPAKYMSVVEAAFRGQTEMFATQDMRGPLLKVAQSAGMNEDQFTKCVSDPAALKAISDRVQKAVTVDHIEGTPTILVNGKAVGTGEISMAQLDAAIQPLLKT